LKTFIEMGKEPGSKPGNWTFMGLMFRVTRLPGVARLHPFVRGDDNNMRFLL
jgi:hypothetical protein